jgi:hypothetical protein
MPSRPNPIHLLALAAMLACAAPACIVVSWTAWIV